MRCPLCRRRRVDGLERHRHAIDANATRLDGAASTPSTRTHRYRAQVPELRAHAWFQQKLPPYLRHAPDRIENLERVIDEDTVDDVLALASRGFAPLGASKQLQELSLIHI